MVKQRNERVAKTPFLFPSIGILNPMIEITPDIQLDEGEFNLDFVRSAGPGGQNVNKVSTAVQLSFDAAHSPSLPEEVRVRLLRLAGRRASKEGVIVIKAYQYRSQEQNRQAAVTRLVELVQQAAERPRVRRPTRPSHAAHARRLAAKKQRSQLKRQRGAQDWE